MLFTTFQKGDSQMECSAVSFSEAIDHIELELALDHDREIR
jgi:hypothetical protein